MKPFVNYKENFKCALTTSFCQLPLENQHWPLIDTRCFSSIGILWAAIVTTAEAAQAHQQRAFRRLALDLLRQVIARPDSQQNSLLRWEQAVLQV
jgi:hypothetical protein